jgi:two-component system response regulator RegX3
VHFDVLMIDDERELAESTTEYLSCFDLACTWVPTAEDAERLLAAHEAAVVLLDVNLPGRSGFEFCRRLRTHSQTPILFCSARAADDDEIMAMSLGGDDYIRKPYSLGVLLAKIRRVMTKAAAEAPTARDFDDGWLRRDTLSGRWWVSGQELPLSALEERLLAFLVDHPGQLLTRVELLENVWGHSIMADGTLSVHIRRLRAKIEPDPDQPRYISTVWGRGYRFEDPTS